MPRPSSLVGSHHDEKASPTAPIREAALIAGVRDNDPTAFESLFREVTCEVALKPAERGTEVGIEMVQRPKGWARVGGMMLKRAARKQCDEALAGLAGLVEGSA